jgi:hypothetical protein
VRISDRKKKEGESRPAWLCLAFLIPIGLIAVIVATGTPSEKGATEAPQPIAALDDSNEPLKSCEWKSVSSIMEGITIVSWSDGSKICQLAINSLRRPIPIGVFRHLLKAAGVLNVKGAGEPDKFAYQLIEIVEARGITDPQRMKDTLDIAFKAYTGSNGRVTPKDLNVAVRQSGLAQTLSDEGLLSLAAMISVEKRNNGE